MSITGLDGFESGNTAQADVVVGAPPAVTSPAYGGTYALQCTGDSVEKSVRYPGSYSSQGEPVNTDIDQWSVLLRMQVATRPNIATVIVDFDNQNKVTLNADGTLTLGSTAGAFVLTNNVWYVLAIKFDSDADNHELRIYSQTMDTLHETITDTTGEPDGGWIKIGKLTSGSTGFDVFFDDLVYESNNSSITYPLVVGNYKIRNLKPTGAFSGTWDNGNFSNINEIPDELKNIYKTVWEISQKELINMTAERGWFVDQSQSFNIHMKNVNYGKLTSMHFYGWKQGLKTGMYYLRTQAAAEPIKFSIDKSLEKKNKEVIMCSLDNPDECLMCSG